MIRSRENSVVKVLVVDDSATMRAVIASCLRTDPGIEVVGEASDPFEARELIKQLAPDVITLDVEMPRMHGLDFLERLMRLRPMPVIMISTLTQASAEIAINALELGAFDCIGKPTDGDYAKAFAGLPALVKVAARSNIRSGHEPAKAPVAAAPYQPGSRVVALGSSTGGLEALMNILTKFPANCPPTVITQHIPASFSGRFAARLNQNSAANVQEAYDDAPLLPGHIYLAPGGDRHLEIAPGVTPVCRLRSGELHSGHRPSVDVLFHSVSQLGDRAVAALLTGMGRDGAEGLAAIRKAGGRTICQDEASSVVFGMPRAAFEMGAAEQCLPLEDISAELLRLSAARSGNGHGL